MHPDWLARCSLRSLGSPAPGSARATGGRAIAAPDDGLIEANRTGSPRRTPDSSLPASRTAGRPAAAPAWPPPAAARTARRLAPAAAWPLRWRRSRLATPRKHAWPSAVRTACGPTAAYLAKVSPRRSSQRQQQRATRGGGAAGEPPSASTDGHRRRRTACGLAAASNHCEFAIVETAP
jgi:hypothetical protein